MRHISSIVAFLIVLHQAQSRSRIKNWFGQNAGEQEPDLVDGQRGRFVLEFQSQADQEMMGQGDEQGRIQILGDIAVSASLRCSFHDCPSENMPKRGRRAMKYVLFPAFSNL